MSDQAPEKPGRSRGQQRGLGRGLSALMDDYPVEDISESQAPSNRDTRLVPIHFLKANPFQPRRNFVAEDLETLSASIAEKGVLQPILVRPASQSADGEQRYEIMAGERRWRASQKAGLHEVPVLIRELDDRAALEVAIIENVQRQDLSPIEEADGYQRLIAEFGHRQEDVAKAVGKSRSHIANLLRLLSLPDTVRAMVDDGRLSMGHARALIGSPDPETLAQRVLDAGLSVRQTEALVAKGRGAGAGAETEKAEAKKRRKDPDTRALEADLGQALGLAVDINDRGAEGGVVSIRYLTLEQLDDLCQKLMEG
ncbi:chromosome segregation DNA-binding protein [Iodidimonas gelatinilytica]|uniref:Chromosome segregation DNA-binding protein n=1 Tax=Iodidimonas gelatinilytica TaxID=1236966 RepID=A0A5A7MNE4_9PROT|nr:ParB/RepB/Spo0J family partition protein [Iodidimonas gelatinilytica]GEQ97510.1 chromosome segregation DNA-binding protein [Iodidimonas gelatinilytica]